MPSISQILPSGLNPLSIQVYLDFWDDFVDQWYQDPINFFNANHYPWGYQYKQLLPSANALPEPYCGDPNNFSAIILNLNPGSVTTNLQQHPNGIFISSFKPGYTYRKFALPFPYLKSYQNTGGGKWWKIREECIERLFKTGKRPFAIDICPWHSKSWRGFQNSQTTINYVNAFVIEPAEIIIKNAAIKIIFSVGKEFMLIFQNLGFSMLNSLGPSTKNVNWPKNGKNQPTNRYFSIWESPNGTIYFNTYSPGANKCPSSVFDEAIISFLKPYI